jgi:hypothetical protein
LDPIHVSTRDAEREIRRRVAGKFNSYPGVQNGYRLLLIAGNKVRFVSTSGSDSIETTNVLVVGTFTHVAATHDGTTGRIYIDGVEAASGPLPLPPDTTMPFSIGCDHANSAIDNPFQGVIDEVIVFDRALSAATILAHVKAR